MLVHEHQFVETHGKSSRQGQANGHGSHDHRRARHAGPALPELQPAQVLPRPPRHHQRHDSEEEGQRDGVGGVEQVDPVRTSRELDRRGQHRERHEPEQQRDPRPGSLRAAAKPTFRRSLWSRTRAWVALLGLVALAVLPAAVEFSAIRIDLLDAAYAIPLAFLLGVVALGDGAGDLRSLLREGGAPRWRARR